MEKQYILAIDMGTQSMRGEIIDTTGHIEAFYQIRYNPMYHSPKPDYAEQSVDFYYDTLCTITKHLRETNPELLDKCIAVSMACIRNSFVCLDENKKPLRESILWLDKRQTKFDTPLPTMNRTLFKLVGMEPAINMIRSSAACNHVAIDEPEIWAKTKHYVSIPCYFYYRLTGNLVDSTANPIGHVPYNYKEGHWSKPNELTRPVFEIKDEMLPPLIKTATVVGTITKEASKETGLKEGLELISGGSDKAAETLGLSVVSENKAAISLGTTATIQFATRNYFEPQPFMPSYPAIPDGMYNAEIQIERGYWMISWFKREFAYKEVMEGKEKNCSPEELLNERLREIPAGCDGLMLQPYWCAGLTNVNAKGSVIGWSDQHNRIYLYRAIIEGIGYALKEGLDIMEKRSKQKIDTIYIGGGGSQSNEICQITANMFGLPVKRIQTYEACGIGCALNGFVGKGVFKDYDEAIKAMVHDKDTFMPDEKEHEIYTKLYKDVYLKIYRSNEHLYKKIREICGGKR